MVTMAVSLTVYEIFSVRE